VRALCEIYDCCASVIRDERRLHALAVAVGLIVTYDYTKYKHHSAGMFSLIAHPKQPNTTALMATLICEKKKQDIELHHCSLFVVG
jgi:hypothetical protein